MRLRRLLLLSLVAFTATCTDQPRDGYTWYKAVPALSKVEWHRMGQAAVNVMCGGERGVTVNGCIERAWATDTCHVYSTYTEEAARKFKPAGTFGKTSLYEHEVGNEAKTLGHCAGFDHREPYLRSPGA